jgi:hypothetical protein
VTGAEAEQGRRLITATNRLAWFFLLRRARRAGRDWAVYAVRPEDITTNGSDHLDQHVSDAAVPDTAPIDTAPIDTVRTESVRTEAARTDTQELS